MTKILPYITVGLGLLSTGLGLSLMSMHDLHESKPDFLEFSNYARDADNEAWCDLVLDYPNKEEQLKIYSMNDMMALCYFRETIRTGLDLDRAPPSSGPP